MTLSSAIGRLHCAVVFSRSILLSTVHVVTLTSTAVLHIPSLLHVLFLVK